MQSQTQPLTSDPTFPSDPLPASPPSDATPSSTSPTPQLDETPRSLRSATRTVYGIPELRAMIFEHTEAGMRITLAQLDRAGLASVAGDIYQSIPRSLVNVISSANFRGKLYCRAVRFIVTEPTIGEDNNQVRHRLQTKRRTPRTPTHFEPSATYLTEWLRKYPSLQRVVHRFPSSPLDDEYVVEVRNGKIKAVAVWSTVQLDIFATDYGRGASPSFPPPPKFAGIAVKHHLKVVLIDGGGELSARLNRSPSLLEAHLVALKGYFYSNPTLDPRICSIDHCRSLAYEHHRPRLSTAEILRSLDIRRTALCPPPSHIYIEDGEDCSAERLGELLGSGGKGLRSVQAGPRVLAAFGEDTQSFIDLVEEFCPGLEELWLSFPGVPVRPLEEMAPLKGLPGLRILTITGYPREASGAMLGYTGGLGGAKTLFLDPKQSYGKDKGSFNSAAQLARASKRPPITP